jgi:hypothetical protein
LDPTTTTTVAARLFAGVDVSKDRLDVCLRWSELERPEEEEEEAFVVAYDDDNGIDALVSRLLEERTLCLWSLWPPAASSERWLGLWLRQDCRW